ncbi:MAG: FIST N-terminal domain-containing protein, partial [Chitinophagales bacterium]
MYIKNPNNESILEAVRDIGIDSQDSLLLMFGEKQVFDFDSLHRSLSTLDISFFGGVFPGLIYEGNRYEDGCILLKLNVIKKPILVHGLQNKNFELPNVPDIEALYGEKRTVLTFVDGLTSNIAAYLSKLYDVLGNTVNFIGGGAGSLTLVQQPCVFTNQGIFQDAAVICFLDYKS